MSVPKPVVSGIFKQDKYSFLLNSGKCYLNLLYSENIMKEVIYQ